MRTLEFTTNVTDKYNHKKYAKGDRVEFEDERADEILSVMMSDGSHYARLVEAKEVETAAKKKSNVHKAVKKQTKKAK